MIGVKMKKNKIWLFKSYTQMVVSVILFILFMIGFVYIGTIDFKKGEVTDSDKFIQEHKEVENDNVFTYVNASDAYNYIRDNNVIILFGIKDSDWVGHYANILNDAAREAGIEKIYYYDITTDREERNGTYESITNYLDMYLTYLDNGVLDIYCPTFIVKKDGMIIYFDDETALVKGKVSASDYWTESKVTKQYNNLVAVLKEYIGDENGEK